MPVLTRARAPLFWSLLLCLASYGVVSGAETMPSEGTASPKPFPTTPQNRIYTYTIHLGAKYTPSYNPALRKFDYVIVNKNTVDAGMAAAVSPDVPVVLYEGLQTRSNYCGGNCAYEEWQLINSRESWFWHDRLGKRVQDLHSPVWYMDYRNPGYLAYLVDRFKRLRNHIPAIDGFFFDQMGFYDGFIRYAVPNMRPGAISPLPTHTEYDKYNIAALDFIKKQLGSAQLIINSNNYAPFSKPVDGSMNEGFVHNNGEGDDFFRPESDWLKDIKTLGDGGNAKKLVFVFPKSRELAAARRIMRYALASYLLGRRSDGYALFCFESRGDALPQYYDEYKTPTGAPIGGYRKDPSGLWVREFQNGVAIVHAGGTRARLTLPLSGRLAGTFTDWDGKCRSGSIALDPNTGQFLLRSNCRPTQPGTIDGPVPDPSSSVLPPAYMPK